MPAQGDEIETLIATMARLPGLGPRSARRVVLHLIRKRHIQRLRTQCVGLASRWHRDNSIGIANRSHQDIAVAAVWICATGVRYRVR